MRSKIKNAILLTEDIFQEAKAKDKEWKEEMIAKGKGKQAVGESFFVFHLKTLKNLLEEIEND
jgi:hypothetical protein|tara:strand:+ start:1250 stop:1438 length:189 start_codon:yes stop_codon:yes gene_type:complete